MQNKFIIIFLSIFLMFITSCGKNDNTEIKKNIKTEVTSTVPVTVITAKKSNFYQFGEYYGRTQGIRRASLINIIGGTVESVNVVEGASVKKGDSLAKISARNAEIILESAILNERISEDNYNTLKKFLKNGNSTPLQVDQAHLNWLNSETQLINAQKSYDGAFCISPIDGIVVSRNINRDDEVNQGQNTFLVEDMSKIEIQIGIPEADMKGIKEGSTAEVFLDLYPNRVWKGMLTRFSRKSSDKNLTFSATIVIDNSDGTILSGTTAKVKLLRNSFTDYVVLPTSVVVNNNDGDYVMLVKDNKAVKQNITLLVSSIEECVVLDGVENGDILVQEGLHLLTDSQELSIIKEGI